MRPATVSQLAALAAREQAHFVKVEVRDSDGEWRDLSALSGLKDWLLSVSIECERLDQPVSQATVSLRRDGPLGDTLAPLMEASPHNRNLADAYAPLLDYGAPIRIGVIVVQRDESEGFAPGLLRLLTEAGELILTEDEFGLVTESIPFVPVFEGRIDRVTWQGDPIQIFCSDLGAWLMDTQIEAIDEYGDEEGVPVEEVMQDILNAWPSVLGGVLLHVPVSPGWLVRRFEQDRVKVLEAIRALALQIGWDVRYRYADDGVFRLTLYEPDRTADTPVFTIGADRYYDVRQLEVKLDDIRNVVAVKYITPEGVSGVQVATDAASVARVGRRYMEIQEAAASNIDSAAEALALAEAAVHDLSVPPVDKEVEIDLCWPLQKDDVVGFSPNGVHYDEAQQYAVVGLRHELSNATGRTTVQLRGAVAGAYREWLTRAANRVRPTIFLEAALTLAPTEATLTFVGGPNVRVRLNNGAWESVTSPEVYARGAVGDEAQTLDVIAYQVWGRADSLVRTFLIPAKAPNTGGPVPSLTAVTATETVAPLCGVAWEGDYAWTTSVTNDLEYKLRLRDYFTGTVLADDLTTAAGTLPWVGTTGDPLFSGYVQNRRIYVDVVRLSDNAVISSVASNLATVETGEPC
ncbi:MAG: hypothetical protein C0503_02875 [Gemmatimonas sp.]|nr:hypothetical protein [Gemmatimonas sp.]